MKFILIFVLVTIGNAHAEKTYKVNFDGARAQLQTLNAIEDKVLQNQPADDDLQILFFGQGRAFRLDAGTMPGASIKYQQTDETVKSKISSLKKQGVKFILCNRNIQKKKNTITSNAGDKANPETLNDVALKLSQLKSQGYSCITP